MNFCKSRFLLVLLSSLSVCGCSRDVTLHPGPKTDFVPGSDYEFQKPVFLHKIDPADSKEVPCLVKLGSSGTPERLEEFKQMRPPDSHVIGLLTPGDRIRVTKLEQDRVPGLTQVFRVYAVITRGAHAGTVVEIYMLTKEARPAPTAFVDSLYLQKIKTPAP